MATITTAWFFPSGVISQAVNFAVDFQGITGNTVDAWENPGLVTAADGSLAENSIGAAISGSFMGYPVIYPRQSDFLVASFTGIDIPTPASNIVLEVIVSRKASQSGVVRSGGTVSGYPVGAVFLYNAATKIGTTPSSIGCFWGTSLTDELFGGAGDAFDDSVTPEILRSGDFKIRFFCENCSASAAKSAYVDSIKYRVTYDYEDSSEPVDGSVSGSSSVQGNPSGIDAVSGTISGVSNVLADIPEDLAANASGISSVQGSPSGIDAVEGTVEGVSDVYGYAESGTDTLEGEVFGQSDVSGTLIQYPLTTLTARFTDVAGGLRTYQFRFGVDETILVDGLSIASFQDVFSIDPDSDIIIESGIEALDGQGVYGVFLPSQLSMQFFLVDVSAPVRGAAFRFFRDAVLSVEIHDVTDDDNLLFRGVIDRQSVAYDNADFSLSAAFRPYLAADRKIKSTADDYDYAFLQNLLDDTSSWSAASSPTAAESWMKLERVIDSLLRFFGATSVEVGNFNRMVSSLCVMPPVGNRIYGEYNNPYMNELYLNTVTGRGFAAGADYEAWLGSTPKNQLFSKLLVSKHMLFGINAKKTVYDGFRPSTVKDVMSNIAGWFAMRIGLSPAGKGFVVPPYHHEDPVLIPDGSVLSLNVSSFLPEVPGVVGIGWITNDSWNLDVSGAVFYPGGAPVVSRRYRRRPNEPIEDVTESSIRGLVRFNNHPDGDKESLGRFSEDTLYEESYLEDSEEGPLKVYFPTEPHLPFISTSSYFAGAMAFGYTESPAENPTHSGDLQGVLYTGSGSGGGWYKQGSYHFPQTTTMHHTIDRYWAFRRIDREVYEVEVLGTGYGMEKEYRFDTGSRYGSALRLSPTHIEENLSKGTTTLHLINITDLES